MSNFESRNTSTKVSIAFWSRGASIGQAGTCGSSATKKLYRCRQMNLPHAGCCTMMSRMSSPLKWPL